MRRDTQIGIILGIVILVIIGVFLSTRTNVNGPKISDLVLSKGGTQHEIKEININDLIKKSEGPRSKAVTSKEKTTSNNQVNDEFIISTPSDKQSNETDIKPNKIIVETPEDNTSLKGKWEGIPEEKREKSQITKELQIAEEPGETYETQIVKEIPYEEEEETLPADEQQVTSDDTYSKTIHKVRPNDNLFKISKKYFGDESNWEKIFEANKDKLSNPHSLYVGQELLIPDGTVEKTKTQEFKSSVKIKPANAKTINAITHTVQSGDTLYRIAGKYYKDPAMWEKIYEANEETIEDKGLLRKGQVLIIPQ